MPPVSGIQIGEIAINYKDGYETLFIKNDNNEIVSFSSDDIILAQAGGGGGSASVDGLFSSVTYNSNAKKIYFYDKNNTQCGEIDTTDFIKDGMISSVTVSNGNLVLAFNTDAGRQDIQLELTQIFNPDNYYTKTQSDEKYPTIAQASGYATTALASAKSYADSLSGNYASNTSFTSHTANTSIHLTTGNVKTQIESYHYISAYTETDPTVPSWAKASTKPSYTANEVGALPTGTTLDNVGDGTTRKLSNYATNANFTAHTGNTTVHVTSSEKSTWNGKQDAISDLETIRNNSSSGATAYSTVTAHTADTAIHVTTSDKSTWNSKQDAINDLSNIRNNASSGATAYSTVTAHTADTTVHVTASDKSTWNGKQDAISDLDTIKNNAASGASAYTGFTAHSADSTIHVTSSEKDTWNGKQNIISDLAIIRSNASSGASAYTGFTAHSANSDIHVTSSEKSTWNGKQDAISNLNTIINNAASGKNAYDNMVTGVTAGGTSLSKSNKVVAIPSASSSTFGVVKTGDFITNTNGTIKVKTGTTANDVAVGNHTHSAYATTGSLNTLSSQTVNHITASTLHMPTVTSSDNGKILQVVNGAWSLVTPVTIYYGSTAPNNNTGNNGDIYIQQ